MHNQTPGPGPNPYDLPTKVVSGILAGVFTFFVFPFAYLSVNGVSAFAGDHYTWVPDWLIWFIWGLILAAGMFASVMLLLILVISMGLKFMGRR